MKRILILVAVSASLSMTTGCAHKKRVKNLEAELTRCYAQKLQLQQSQAEQPATEEELAQLDEPQ